MSNIDKLIVKIDKFATDSKERLIKLREDCKDDKELFSFLNRILDFYVSDGGFYHNVLWDLNGFLRKDLPPRPDSSFLGKITFESPLEFLAKLDSFIYNCILDDASCWILWRKIKQEKRLIIGKETTTRSRDEHGNLMYIDCDPFNKDADPVIMADWSGQKGDQDVAKLNKVIDFVVEKNNRYLEDLKKAKDIIKCSNIKKAS